MTGITAAVSPLFSRLATVADCNSKRWQMHPLMISLSSSIEIGLEVD